MCEHCEAEANEIRTVVDALVAAEEAALRVHVRHSQGQHVVRLANMILDAHQDDQGYMNETDVKCMALGYATVVQRLISLQQMAGLSPP